MSNAENTLSLQHFGPSLPVISRRLCAKAGRHNEQLTQAERWLFLSRLDLYGKMLAYPRSLDNLQLNQVVGHPPSDVLARILWVMTGHGSIADVMRVYQGPDGIDSLSYGALEAITMGWWTFDTIGVYGLDDKYEDDAVVAAACLVAEALRPKEFAFEAAVKAKFLDPETTQPEGDEDIVRLEEETMTEEQLDARREEYFADLDAMADEVKRSLQEQLEQELAAASEGDLLAIKEVRTRMKIEAAEDIKGEEERIKEISESERLDEDGNAFVEDEDMSMEDDD